MKKLSLSIFLILSCAPLFGMEWVSPFFWSTNVPSAPPPRDDIIAIPRQEFIQLDDIEAFTASAFSELIDSAHKSDKDYLFARVETESAANNGQKYTHYFDATELNKMLITSENNFRSVASVRNPVNRLPIQKVTYYMIRRGSKQICEHVGSYDDFTVPAIMRWNKLFPQNQLPERAISNNNNRTIASQHSINQPPARLIQPQVTTRTALLNNQHNAPHPRPSGCIRNCAERADICLSNCPSLTYECIALLICGTLSGAIDSACLPCACLTRMCKSSNNPNRNDAFCYCMRANVCPRVDCTTCCEVDITVPNYDNYICCQCGACIDAYCCGCSD